LKRGGVTTDDEDEETIITEAYLRSISEKFQTLA